MPDGKVTSFPVAVQRRDDETVVFAWITWPSRRAPDDGMAKVIADPRLQPEANPMPFDGQRMIFGPRALSAAARRDAHERPTEELRLHDAPIAPPAVPPAARPAAPARGDELPSV